MLFVAWDRCHRPTIVISTPDLRLVGMKAAQLGMIPGCDLSQAEQLVSLINIVKYSGTEV